MHGRALVEITRLNWIWLVTNNVFHCLSALLIPCSKETLELIIGGWIATDHGKRPLNSTFIRRPCELSFDLYPYYRSLPCWCFIWGLECSLALNRIHRRPRINLALSRRLHFLSITHEIESPVLILLSFFIQPLAPHVFIAVDWSLSLENVRAVLKACTFGSLGAFGHCIARSEWFRMSSTSWILLFFCRTLVYHIMRRSIYL